MSADQAEDNVDLNPASNSGTKRHIILPSDDDVGPEDEYDTGPDIEETSQNIYKIIRLAKADLEKFSNFDPADIPDTLEKTQGFIERFIEKKKKPRKRKLDDQSTSSGEPQYERLTLRPEQEATLGTSSQDFKLLIFHSKHVSSCLGQEFTTKLVNCSDGEKIVTKVESSSLIYFFYRILENIKKPEIIIVTMGHTWRIANELADESFSNSIKEKDLEDEAVSQKVMHTSGGPVLSTEQHARGGKTLRPITLETPEVMEQRSTRYAKSNAALNKRKALKQGSRIYLSKTSLSASLSLDIAHLHQFIKYVAETSQTYQAKKFENLQEVENKNLLEKLDKELLKRLTEKDSKNQYCTKSYLQHEDTEEWNNATELRLHIPATKTRGYDIPLPFNVVIRELTKHKIPEVDWLEKIKISWKRNKEPRNKEPLKHFLEDYVRVDGVFYRFLFGKWLTITYEYVTEKDKQFKEIMAKDFLEASLDFPILPWLHKDKDDERQTVKTTQHYNNRNSPSPLIQSTRSSRRDTHLTPASQTADIQDSGIGVSQPSALGPSVAPGRPLTDTHLTSASQTGDNQDSETGISQSPAFGQSLTPGCSRTDTHLTPANQSACSQDSGKGVSQSSVFGQSLTSSCPATDTHLTPTSQTSDSQDSETGISQPPALGQSLTLSCPWMDTHLTPGSQTADNQDTETESSQSPALNQTAHSQYSRTGINQSSALGQSLTPSCYTDTYLTQGNNKAVNQDSGTGISQLPALGRSLTPRCPRTDTYLTPTSQTAGNQDSGIDVSQPPALSQSSHSEHSKTRKNLASRNQAFQHDNIPLDDVCKQSGIGNMKTFKTEGIKLEKELKMIHFPVEVHFDRMLPDQSQVDGSIKTMTYSLGIRRKVNQSTYYIPYNPKEFTTNELENLLFLRLNTQMSEGEYNDCHILLRIRLKCYEHKRFIIIPGDELFVADKNTELYDILISDEEKRITYIIHVKAGFDKITREAYSQLRLSAQKIHSSLLYQSSTSALEQYWEHNSRCEFTKEGYTKDVAAILSKMGKENFLDLFGNEERRLVFVFACRDSRENILKQEAKRGTLHDTHVSVENILRKDLKEKCHLKKISNAEEIITKVIDKLRQLEILNYGGQITDKYKYQKYKYQNEEGKKPIPILREVTEMVPHGLKGTIEKSLKNWVPISNSDIAKFELVNLKREFQEFRVGEKQFELKICQIPMELYLKQSGDCMTDVDMSGDHVTRS